MILTFFFIFRDFSSENSKKSINWDFSVGKNPENLKISKICFLQIFCFYFAYNLAKNGHKWVIWWKVIRFFRWKKSFFFTIFSIIFHTNTPKTARSAQLRDIISRQQTNLLPFCKKLLLPYNPNLWNKLHLDQIKFWPLDPPPYPLILLYMH